MRPAATRAVTPGPPTRGEKLPSGPWRAWRKAVARSTTALTSFESGPRPGSAPAAALRKPVAATRASVGRRRVENGTGWPSRDVSATDTIVDDGRGQSQHGRWASGVA